MSTYEELHGKIKKEVIDIGGEAIGFLVIANSTYKDNSFKESVEKYNKLQELGVSKFLIASMTTKIEEAKKDYYKPDNILSK